jgi:hypothetical protein
MTQFGFCERFFNGNGIYPASADPLSALPLPQKLSRKINKIIENIQKFAFNESILYKFLPWFELLDHKGQD